MKNKILLIGPMPKPITGVSICNDTIVNKLSKDDFEINYIDTSSESFDEKLGAFSLKKFFFSLKQYLGVFKISKVDIVYLTIGQTFLGVLKYYPYFLFAKIFGKETIIHIHGNFLRTQYDSLKGIKKLLFARVLKMANKGIVLSESLEPNLTPFLNDKDIYVLYNFVEEILFKITKEEIETKNTTELKIVYLSNLMTEKGIFDLIKSLEILSKKNIKYTAKLAGNIDASIKDSIVGMIDSLEDVEYVGVVRGEEKRNLLVESNVFAFPSYYQMEGQPIAILEAMVAGNIVLTTNHAGIPDIFTIKNGMYIDKKSPESIAEKLEEIGQNLSSFKLMMLQNHNYVKKTFTEQAFLDNLAEIFRT